MALETKKVLINFSFCILLFGIGFLTRMVLEKDTNSYIHDSDDLRERTEQLIRHQDSLRIVEGDIKNKIYIQKKVIDSILLTIQKYSIDSLSFEEAHKSIYDIIK